MLNAPQPPFPVKKSSNVTWNGTTLFWRNKRLPLLIQALKSSPSGLLLLWDMCAKAEEGSSSRTTFCLGVLEPRVSVWTAGFAPAFEHSTPVLKKRRRFSLNLCRGLCRISCSLPLPRSLKKRCAGSLRRTLFIPSAPYACLVGALPLAWLRSINPNKPSTIPGLALAPLTATSGTIRTFRSPTICMSCMTV